MLLAAAGLAIALAMAAGTWWYLAPSSPAVAEAAKSSDISVNDSTGSSTAAQTDIAPSTEASAIEIEEIVESTIPEAPSETAATPTEPPPPPIEKQAPTPQPRPAQTATSPQPRATTPTAPPTRTTTPAPTTQVQTTPAPAPEPPPAPPATTPPAPTTPSTPLEILQAELKACDSRGGLIARGACILTTRHRYCGDMWGKVPECPLSNTQTTD